MDEPTSSTVQYIIDWASIQPTIVSAQVVPRVMQEASEEAAWRVIVAALKEMGVTNVDHNAKAIIARLSQAGMLVVAEYVSVSICINGHPIHARTAVNHGEQPSGFTKYLLDDGSTVLHKPGDGVVALAIQLLKSIK